ncbi:chemotaxis protein CheA [Methanothermococcus sp. SCGC AD-155-N22]|nr:chemotaxis protein CheA [Methanothermococcus sp. SCGC AD-155-N22]
MDEMEQYRELFLAEAMEHLQALNQYLVELENNPENLEIINLIFRSAHTLKGSARTVGFDHISNLTHHMEDILDYLREGKIPVTSEIMDLLFECLDALETMVNEIEEGITETSVDVDSIVEKIKKLKEKYLSGAGVETKPKEEKKEDTTPTTKEEKEEEKKEPEKEPSKKTKIKVILKNPTTTLKVKKVEKVPTTSEEEEVKKPKNLEEILEQMSKSVEVLSIIAEALEYSELKTVLKKIEELVKKVMDDSIVFTKSVMEALKCSLDAMEKIAKTVEEGKDLSNIGVDLSELSDILDKALATKSKEEVSEKVEEYEVTLDHTKFKIEEYGERIKELFEKGHKLYHLKAKTTEDCALKCATLLMVLNTVKKIGEVLDTIPKEEALKEGEGGDELEILFLSDKPMEEIQKELDAISEIEYIAISPVDIELKVEEEEVEEVKEEEKKEEKEEKKVDEDLQDAYKVEVIIDEECLLKSVRAYMVIKELEDLGEIVKVEPSLEMIQKGEFKDTKVTIYLITNREPDDIKEAVLNIPEIKEVYVEPQKYMEGVETKKTEPKPQQKEEDKKKKETPAKKAPKATTTTKKSSTVQTVRVNIEKLDKLMNLVGELVINRANFAQIAEKYDIKELHNAVNRLNMLITELQEEVMAMRMIPVSFIFNRFPRTVRDLAKALNKEVELIIEGSDIELDRTVLDELAEPLTHIIRNAIDHGIEPPEEREKLGKPRKGKLILKAVRERNHVLIIVEDDGRGIDPEVIKRKAIEKGLITEEEAKRMSDQEAINLIFLPGFSTAEKVSDVSGRGVGMDVVKTKIESLGGSVTVYSEKGKGTRVVLQLPLTMAIVLALLIRLKDQVYAIPLTSVLDVTHVKREEIKNIEGQDAILYRGDILPVVWLKDILNFPWVDEEEPDEIYIVVIERNKGKLGVVVDDVIGREEIVVKPLQGILKNIQGFAGATILGDGRVAFILDLNNV